MAWADFVTLARFGLGAVGVGLVEASQSSESGRTMGVRRGLGGADGGGDGLVDGLVDGVEAVVPLLSRPCIFSQSAKDKRISRA